MGRVAVRSTKVRSDKDLLSEASGGTVTEVEIAIHGAVRRGSLLEMMCGQLSHTPTCTGRNNIDDMLGNRDDSFRFSNMLYGTVSLYSPRQQEHNAVCWLL